MTLEGRGCLEDDMLFHVVLKSVLHGTGTIYE
jgi:hypothetical protein